MVINMNRYDGNTGRYVRVPEKEPVMYQPPPFLTDGGTEEYKKPSGQSGILDGLGGILGGSGGLGNLGGIGSLLGGSGGLGGLGSILGGSGGLGSILGGNGNKLGGGLGGILSKFSISNLELEDIMLVAFLYLLYRESGDIEFLLIAGAMLFL